jgi:RNA polymerase sigma-70 factor (ECF subfamily)
VSLTTNPLFVGGQNDFEGVVSLYSPVLFRVAFRRLRNIQDAEDAVQDALLSAHKCIGQFQGRSKLSTWLTRIVTNTALMKLRRHSRYEIFSLGQDDDNDGMRFANKLIDARPSPETIYAQTETEEILRRALAQLSPKLRSAIQLYELEGLPIQEAAKALGISENTLKSRVARGRKSLNSIFGEVIKTRRASKGAADENRTGTVCRHRRSPVHREVSTDETNLVEQRSPVCVSSYVPASHHNEILSHAEMHVEHTEIHYPPHPLEIVPPRSPLSYAT